MSADREDICASEKTRKLERSSLDRQDDDSCQCTSERSETDVSSAVAYLSRHLSAILPAALGEIALKKPVDPLEYLGQWLLHYRECEDRERRRREFEAELLEERLKLPRVEAVIAENKEDVDDDANSDC